MANIETYHSGHRYVNGMHWIAQCPTCSALVAKAEQVAASAANDSSKR